MSCYIQVSMIAHVDLEACCKEIFDCTCFHLLQRHADLCTNHEAEKPEYIEVCIHRFRTTCESQPAKYLS